MRTLLLFSWAGLLFAQQPVLYNRGAVNAASLAPAGLPNAPIGLGSIFSVFGENLGPAQPQTVSAFPLSTTFGGVSLSVTRAGVTTQVFPIFVSAGQINAVMPSTVAPGLATLRLFYQGVKSNAITIQIAKSAPGVFAISSGGYGPGIVQNFVSDANQPINSLTTPAAPGQTVIIWGTGLGPVTFPDNVAPTAGNVATPVAVTIGGQPAANAYSGRTPCCSGVDQIVATVPANVPLGCWVPVTINAGGLVSNTATMAIAAPGATSCSDAGNPLSALVRTPGTQAYIDLERMDTVENVNSSPAVLKTMDKLYTRFYTRPNSPYNFDPYMSYPPAGACLVHQTSGDAFLNKTLRGALPASASLNQQPKQTYNNGTQALTVSPHGSYFSSTVAASVNSTAVALNPLGANATFTIDPGGANQMSIPLNLEPPPAWARPNAIIVAPRSAPLALSFTPGDSAAPTGIVLYSYSAFYNSTVEVQCLAPPGASTFTIPADTLANLPATYGLLDGSYANLFIGTVGLNKATSFTNGLASSGVLLTSNWLAQSVVIQ
jgi:uncharacterized protein (TIGR03437 family)